MSVLGIDPGTATMGYGVVARGARGLLEHRAHGVILTPSNLAPEMRLAKLYAELVEILKTYQPEAAAIEELFFKDNVTTGINVAQARGVAMLACAHTDVPVYPYQPTQVKKGVVGVGRATKQQMQYMVQRLLGLKEIPKPDDAADGLAIAICHLNMAPVNARLSASLS